jgi:aquaporin Z
MLTQSVRRSLAEFFGTFMLVFAGTSAAMFAGDGLLAVALAFGLVIAAGIYAVGHISGGHFNPAVSLAMLIDGRLSWKEFAYYVVSQLGGAAFGAVVVFLIGGASTDASPLAVEAWVVIAYEVVLTYIFVYTILSVSKRKELGSFVGLIVGFTLAALILAGGAVSGAALNPAGAFGPALFVEGAFANYWLYAVGTFTGAGLAALTYKFLGVATE